MWEKRATSAEGYKTIRIAESSDMDSWKAVLRPCASFERFEFEKENEVENVPYTYANGSV